MTRANEQEAARLMGDADLAGGFATMVQGAQHRRMLLARERELKRAAFALVPIPADIAAMSDDELLREIRGE